MRQFKPNTKRAPTWRGYLEQRQKKLSLRLFGVLLACHVVPQLRPYTSKFFHLQAIDHRGKATISIDDVYFVLMWIVNLTFIRSALMDYMWYPLGKLWGIKSHKALTRFAEQGWMVVYYMTAWVWGMVLLSKADYATSVDNVWTGWPHARFDTGLKTYYLVQMACWLCQCYVLNIEKPRKDHIQMCTHHLVTCALVAGSYYYYHMPVGHLILLLMDHVDLWLSTAKMLKYLGFSRLCDVIFGVFLVTWLVFRHGFYNYITWSAWTRAPELIGYQCFHDSDTGELLRCYKPQVHNTFVALLVALQIITIIWLWMIIRVVIKILRGGYADDTRSDDEDDEEEGKRDEEQELVDHNQDEK